jgi:LysM repeat protein
MFAEKYAMIPGDQKTDWEIHTVRRNETLSSIAQRYGLSVGLLREVNKSVNPRRLSVGKQIAIPLPKDMAAKRAKKDFDYDREIKRMTFDRSKMLATAAKGERSKSVSKPPAGREKLVYRVKRRDTLGQIAEMYGVRASNIRNWNDIAYGEYIRPGQDLVIWVPHEKVASVGEFELPGFSNRGGMNTSDFIDYSQGTGPKGSGTVVAPSQNWIQHVVQEGESLDRIARRYGVTITDLKNWNKLSGTRIRIGQVLDVFGQPDSRVNIITTAPTTRKGNRSTTPVAPSGLIHKVKKGETLSTIARRFSVRPKVLMAYNHLRSTKLRVGQRLRIPQNTHATNFIYHTVKRGDTLAKLSRRYGVPVEQIRGSNNLVADGLRVGDRVAIPTQ